MAPKAPAESDVSLHAYLQRACQLLQPLANARLDAELLLAYTLKTTRSYLLAWPQHSLTAAQAQQFQQLVQRRLAGEAIAHIVGEKEFWSLTLTVTADTLIPRPDSELLVERVLATLTEAPVQIVADLGTGCGAIALAIAKERPHWQIIATDNSPASLAVAKTNASKLSLPNVRFYAGDWCQALPAGLLHAIVSNPPYIAEQDPHLAASSLRWEPYHALVAGKDGIEALAQIIIQAKQHLLVGGWLLLEHGFEQAPAVQQRLQQAGYKNLSTHLDLAGHPRVTMGQN